MDALPFVRVTADHGGTHYASVRLYEKYVADAARFATPSPMVSSCTVRLAASPRLTLAPTTCGFCEAFVSRVGVDVTTDYFAECLA